MHLTVKGMRGSLSFVPEKPATCKRVRRIMVLHKKYINTGTQNVKKFEMHIARR
jgi:hypothetical protein